MAKRQRWWIWLLVTVGGALLFMFLYSMGMAPVSLGTDFQGGFVSRMPLWLAVGVSVLTVLGVTSALLSLYALWIRLTERQWPDDLPMRRMLPSAGTGFLTGFLLLSAVTGVIALLGGYRVVSVPGDVLRLVSQLLFFLPAAAAEEIVFRGILFRRMDRRWGTLVALVVSALLFGFLHITNQNATVWSSFAIAIEAGLLLAAAYKYADNLWLPIGIHWAWNWTQGPLFGFAVSGMDTSSFLAPSIEGPMLLTGGEFGAEGSLVAVILGAGLSFYYLWRKSRQDD